STQVLHVAKKTRPNGKLAWRFELSPSLAAFIGQSPAGDLTMPAVTDTDEGVVVVTTPANPFVLKGMKPGETRSFSQSVSVNYLDAPTERDYSGSLTGTYTYVRLSLALSTLLVLSYVVIMALYAGAFANTCRDWRSLLHRLHVGRIARPNGPPPARPLSRAVSVGPGRPRHRSTATPPTALSRSARRTAISRPRSVRRGC